MAEHFFDDLIEDTATTTQALGRLAEDDTVANLLVQSYRAQDHQTFRAVLERYDLVDRCALICRWLT